MNFVRKTKYEKEKGIDGDYSNSDYLFAFNIGI